MWLLRIRIFQGLHVYVLAKLDYNDVSLWFDVVVRDVVSGNLILQGIYTKGRVRSMGVVRRNAYEKELDSTIEKIYSFIRVLFRSVLLSRKQGGEIHRFDEE